MNIRNVGSQESTGLKYIDNICSKFYLKLWFESGWYFRIILPSQDALKCDPETKISLHIVRSEAAVCRYSSKQVFLKILHKCFPVNIAKFLRAAFLEKTCDGCFSQFGKVSNVQQWAPTDLSSKSKTQCRFFQIAVRGWGWCKFCPPSPLPTSNILLLFGKPCIAFSVIFLGEIFLPGSENLTRSDFGNSKLKTAFCEY